jgi:uncharacterized protein (DUF362 family)
MNGPIEVLLDRCSYEYPVLRDLLERLAPFLGIDHSLAGKKILLKPNLISSRGPILACTNPDFIIGIARWFVEQGADVVIGDSPAFGSATAVLKRIGIHTELSRLGVKVVEFVKTRIFILVDNVEVHVAAEALACDLFVNLPKIKAHNQMGVTLAVKNIFGIVKGLQKALLHMQHGDTHARFAEILLALIDIVPKQITIADGIEVMHVSGPMHGESLSLQCVAASFNPLAVDTAFLSLLEIDPEKIPIWLAANRRERHGTQMTEIDFPFLHPSAFFGSGFKVPDILSPVRFNPFRFLHSSMKRIILALRS